MCLGYLTSWCFEPCYRRGSPYQDPAGNWTTWRSPDDRKETQTAVVRLCLPFIRSGQNHLARHSERVKKTRRTRKRWEDNIREWTGLQFSKSQRAVENREKWRKLVAKSSVVPSRLRNWWWWWYDCVQRKPCFLQLYCPIGTSHVRIRLAFPGGNPLRQNRATVHAGCFSVP